MGLISKTDIIQLNDKIEPVQNCVFKLSIKIISISNNKLFFTKIRY